MRDMIKMVLVLTLLCSTAGFALAYLKISTASGIEEQILTYVQQPAIKKVFPDVDNAPVAERKKFHIDGKSITVFPAKKGGTLIGVAIEDFGKGYGGDIGVMVGINITTDKLIGIGITTMKETPGLGTVIAEPNFTKKFIGLTHPIAVTSQGGTIDTISGATISSVGTVTAVANAVNTYMKLKPEIINWK